MSSGTAEPLPDPVNATDVRVVEGPNWKEVQDLLAKTRECAEADWRYRQLRSQRGRWWARLRYLGINVGRIRRNYVVDGEYLISHPQVIAEAKRGGFVHPTDTEEEEA